MSGDVCQSRWGMRNPRGNRVRRQGIMATLVPAGGCGWEGTGRTPAGWAGGLDSLGLVLHGAAPAALRSSISPHLRRPGCAAHTSAFTYPILASRHSLSCLPHHPRCRFASPAPRRASPPTACACTLRRRCRNNAEAPAAATATTTKRPHRHHHRHHHQPRTSGGPRAGGHVWARGVAWRGAALPRRCRHPGQFGFCRRSKGKRTREGTYPSALGRLGGPGQGASPGPRTPGSAPYVGGAVRAVRILLVQLFPVAAAAAASSLLQAEPSAAMRAAAAG